MSADPAGDERAAGIIRFPDFVDDRGALAVYEAAALPFPVQRMFVVHDVPSGVARGGHAHTFCHQLLVCTSGAVRVSLDDGRRQWEVLLDEPTLGLHVAPMVWASEHDFTPGATLLVLASHPYDADEYIRDYDAFRTATG